MDRENNHLHQGVTMKRLIISALLSVFFVSSAFADWSEDFDTNLATQGIEIAVQEALKIGKSPTDIVQKTDGIEGLNPQNVLKALYCAGAPGDDIKAAADSVGISELMVLAAFDKSIVECGIAVKDSQAYTPVGQQISFQPTPNPTPRPASLATL